MSTMQPRRMSVNWGRNLCVGVLSLAVATVIVPVFDRAVRPMTTDIALIGAVSVTLYQPTHANQSRSWRARCARGIAILMAFMLAQRFLR